MNDLNLDALIPSPRKHMIPICSLTGRTVTKRKCIMGQHVSPPLFLSTNPPRWSSSSSSSTATAEKRSHEVLQHVPLLITPLWDEEDLCGDLRKHLAVSKLS